MLNNNNKSPDNKNMEDQDFAELEALFGQPQDELTKTEKISLSENLEGFASCFPAWDLHPPKRK